MHGHHRKWLAAGLAVVVGWAGSSVALGQQAGGQYLPADPAYSQYSQLEKLAQAPAPGKLASTTTFKDEAPADELAGRVAELEAALKKIKDKEAKKKSSGKPNTKVGGRLFADWAHFTQNGVSDTQLGDLQNGFEMRKVRIFVGGEVADIFDYKLQFDFAGTQRGTVDVLGTEYESDRLQACTFKDVYFTVNELPWLGHVRVGHFYEPFSLEQNTSSKYITFMERANVIEALSPSRNVGVMAFDSIADQRATWAVGAFINEIGDEPPRFVDDRASTALTMRFTWLPWYDEATEGRGLFHVGANYSYREVADQGIRFRGTPGSHLAGNVADTTGIGNIMDYQLFGAEMAWVYGPLSVQSEYIAAYTNRSAGLVEPQYDGVYVQASYFLTGEHRPYKRGRGIFGRVKPFENFFRVRTCDGDVVTGLGAWEVAYRYSYADMLHPGVAGSRRLGDHSLGLNWYLSPYTRLMFNYINADANQQGLAGTGNIDIYQMRAQIDF